MTLDPQSPVIVGVGQFLHHAVGLDDALEPVALMQEAIVAAGADAGVGGAPDVDALRVVSSLSWRYRNPAWVLAGRMGLTPKELAYTTAGGNTPQMLVNTTSLQILSGELDAAILVGGEAWRTRMRARRDGAILDWAKAPEEEAPVMLGRELDMTHPYEAERGIYLPVHVYPMFETAVRAAAGRQPDDQVRLVSELWSRFSAVAAANPFAWTRTAQSAEQIGTVSAQNRMIGSPYRKVMNSNNDVDMAAAVIICSVERAQRWGVPEDRWVFPHAGTDCHEHQFVSNRDSFARTPAVEIGGRRVLHLAGAGIDDIDVIDLYSCFPSAVQLGAQSLGIGLDRQLTRTGGLCFAGGPWNNYVMHAIATMVGDLRQRPGELGLVWANGGYTTKHSFGVYASTPPTAGFRHDTPQDEVDALPKRELATAADAAGAATIEAYTVMHARNGAPEQTIAACLLADGRRAWGTSAHPDVLAALTADNEWVGHEATLAIDGALHV